MSNKVSGGCLCGSVRFECDKDKLFGGTICHCRDCQFVSGGSPALVVAVPDDGLNLQQGDLKSFSVKGASGNDVTRKFCNTCGTPVFSQLGVAPGLTIIKVGTFDDPSFFKAEMTVWTSGAQPWAHIGSDIPSFEQAPG